MRDGIGKLPLLKGQKRHKTSDKNTEQHVDVNETGYTVIHPTKGPRRYTFKRVEAERRTHELKYGKAVL